MMIECIAAVMRVLCMMFLAVVMLALGSVSKAAQATPCPFHALDGGQPDAARDSVRSASGDVAAEAVFVAADSDRSETDPPHPRRGHQVPEGEACCHAVPTAVASNESSLGLRTSVSVDARRSWPQHWAEPGTDIYRPPAFS